MALASTQPLTEFSTRNLPGGEGRLAHKADTLHHLWASCLENVGASTSHNRICVHGLLHSYVYLFFCTLYLHCMLWIDRVITPTPCSVNYKTWRLIGFTMDICGGRNRLKILCVESSRKECFSDNFLIQNVNGAQRFTYVCRPRQTSRLTVGRNITLTLTLTSVCNSEL
jgi:hypothetical protein